VSRVSSAESASALLVARLLEGEHVLDARAVLTVLVVAAGNAGATAKAIQELAGRVSLSTTQRYMHLSIRQRKSTRSGSWTRRSSGETALVQ
jgi:hypothetical protein